MGIEAEFYILKAPAIENAPMKALFLFGTVTKTRYNQGDLVTYLGQTYAINMVLHDADQKTESVDVTRYYLVPARMNINHFDNSGNRE